jgi:hypothetical protein
LQSRKAFLYLAMSPRVVIKKIRTCLKSVHMPENWAGMLRVDIFPIPS